MRSAPAVPKHVGSAAHIDSVTGDRLVGRYAERRRPVWSGFDTGDIGHDRKRKKRRAGVSVDEVQQMTRRRLSTRRGRPLGRRGADQEDQE